MRRTLAIVLFTALAGPAFAGNIVMNGSFEFNTAGVSRFNNTNAEFNGYMPSATAFGAAEEIDIYKGTDLDSPAPQNGNWKLALHQRVTYGSDAFSLTLSAPVHSGDICRVDFYASYSNESGPVQVGLSSSATSFGTLIVTGTPSSTTTWSHFTAYVVAPVDAMFLTVSTSASSDNMYVFVDNLTLSVPTPAAAFPLAGFIAFGHRRRAARWN